MAIFNRTCVQISLDAIEHNYTAIRKVFGPTRVMTVLKGNAYGHGIRGILSACDPHTDTYAVATAEEGAEIRSWGSRKEVLLFGPVPVCQMAQAAAQELTFTVGSLAYAQTLSAQLQAAGLEARCLPWCEVSLPFKIRNHHHVSRKRFCHAVKPRLLTLLESLREDDIADAVGFASGYVEME